jgi:hypothetical protein
MFLNGMYRLYRMLLVTSVCVMSVAGFGHSQTFDQTYGSLYNPLLHGAACNTTTLNAAIAAPASLGKSIKLSKTDRTKTDCEWQITSNVTMANTRQLDIPRGVTVNIATGITLSACIEAGDYEIFTGPGAVIIPANCTSRVKAIWWPKTRAGLAIADAAAVASTLLLEMGGRATWAIESDITISSHTNITRGVLISVADNITLTYVHCPEAGYYPIFDANTDTTGTIIGKCHEWPVQWFGALGDGTTDDASAFTTTCNTVRLNHQASETAQVMRMPGGYAYSIGATIQCRINDTTADNREISFMAYGARFLSTADITMIDFSNPSVDCTNSAAVQAADNWAEPFVRKMWWYGGVFEGPGTENVNSTMMRAYGIRGMHVVDTHALHFHTMMDVCVQASFYLRFNRWGDFVYGLVQPEDSVDDVRANDAPGLPGGGGQSSTIWNIIGNQFGAESAPCHTVIGLFSGAMQSVLIEGNSLAGHCSNAWIDIVTGESNTRDNQAINVIGNTSEQADISADAQAYGYRFRRRAGTTRRSIAVNVAGNELRFAGTSNFTAMEFDNVWGLTVSSNFIESQNAADWTGILINDVIGMNANANHFETSHTPGGTTACWKITGDDTARVSLGNFTCGEAITIDDSAYHVTDAVSGITTNYGRHRYRVGNGMRFMFVDASNRDFFTLKTNDLDGDVGISTGDGVIDMKNVLNLGPDFLGGQRVVPWGYYVRLQLRDSGSEAPTYASGYPTPSIALTAIKERPDPPDPAVTVPFTDRLMCSVAGMQNDSIVQCEGLVRANVDGNMYGDWRATGVGTLRAKVVILAIIE